jgi:Ca-activated chloride channel family protein
VLAAPSSSSVEALPQEPEAASPAAPLPHTTVHTLGDLSVRVRLDRPQIRDGEERYVLVEVEGGTDVDAQALDLALVVDASGSMQGRRMDQLKQAVNTIGGELDEQDRVALVSFRSKASLHHSGPMELSFFSALHQLQAWGDTNLYDGLTMGLDAVREGGRVVVLSDGEPTVGPRTVGDYLPMLNQAQNRGVTVSALGLGGSFDPWLLTALSDAGGGSYHYVDDAEFVGGMLIDELSRARHVAAHGVTVDLVTEGLQVEEAYGYEAFDGGRRDFGWTTFLGDVAAGEQRKVVARVRVQAGYLGEVVVRSDAGELRIPIHADFLKTGEESVVDEAVAQQVLRARAGDVMVEHARLRSLGYVDVADTVFNDGNAALSGLESTYGVVSPEVDVLREAEEMDLLSEQLRAVGYME